MEAGGSYTLNTIDRPAVVSFQERSGKPGGVKESLSRASEQEPCPPSTTKAYSMCDSQATEQETQGDTATKQKYQEALTQRPSPQKQTTEGLPSSSANSVVAGFSFGQSEKARSIGYQEEMSPTLRGGEGGNQKPCIMCGNPWDSQSERVYHGDGAWHSLNANESGGGNPVTESSLSPRTRGTRYAT